MRPSLSAVKNAIGRSLGRFNEAFGGGLLVAVASITAFGLVIGLVALAFFNSAPPTSLTLAAGPEGSAFRAVAGQYQRILARQGVTLRILATQGSHDNLARLSDPRQRVDVGFVLGGETPPADGARLLSLGSVSYQPLMIFYRGAPKTLLSAFKGMRLSIGGEGSGANALTLALLAVNGIAPGKDTPIVDTSAEASVKDLLDGRIDALFAMSDSTPTAVMRQLLRSPDIHLFSFAQAEGYAHRFTYLNRLVLPRGSIDFGEDIPAADVNLVAPTVELVARASLHPALSDLLLEAAREVHGRAGLYKKAGEFPTPLEHDFPISPDATRYYASGKSFLYRSFPFWIASLITRIAAVVVPMTIVLVPGFKIAPAIYRWRMQSRIYRWYAALQRLEREARSQPLDAARCAEWLRRLEHIDSAVARIAVPPAFGDQLYDLRGHVAAVREGLAAQALAAPTREDAHRPS